MNLWDFFKKKKVKYSDAKNDLNDDIYIDDEMKTFNPEDANNDLSLEAMQQETIVPDPSMHVHVVQGVQDKLKAQEIRVDFTPINYNDIQKAAWALQHAKRIVLSVEKMTTEDRSRTLNFFAGMIYALDGSVEHYSRNIFIFEATRKHS